MANQFGFQRQRALRGAGTALNLAETARQSISQLGQEQRANRMLTSQLQTQLLQLTLGAQERKESTDIQREQLKQMGKLRKAQVEALQERKDPQFERMKLLYTEIGKIAPEDRDEQERELYSMAARYIGGVPEPTRAPIPDRLPTERPIGVGEQIGRTVLPFLYEKEPGVEQVTTQARGVLQKAIQSLSRYASKTEAVADVRRLVSAGTIPKRIEGPLFRAIREHPTLK